MVCAVWVHVYRGLDDWVLGVVAYIVPRQESDGCTGEVLIFASLCSDVGVGFLDLSDDDSPCVVVDAFDEYGRVHAGEGLLRGRREGIRWGWRRRG